MKKEMSGPQDVFTGFQGVSMIEENCAGLVTITGIKHRFRAYLLATRCQVSMK